MNQQQGLGRAAEAQAESFLLKQGWSLIERNLKLNWGPERGEIDLLMLDLDGTVVLVEVKSSAYMGIIGPEARLNYPKRRKLQALARVIATQYPESNIRVDGVTLYLDQAREWQFKHYQNITGD
ncbi:MAG: YraN family protein [Methanothrix sp.]